MANPRLVSLQQAAAWLLAASATRTLADDSGSSMINSSLPSSISNSVQQRQCLQKCLQTGASQQAPLPFFSFSSFLLRLPLVLNHHFDRYLFLIISAICRTGSKQTALIAFQQNETLYARTPDPLFPARIRKRVGARDYSYATTGH